VVLGARALSVVAFDPLRNKAYRATRLGRDVADFLAWMELGGASPKTLLNYEADLARGALMFPQKDVATLTDGDALQIAKAFPTASRRVRVASWRSFYKWALRTRRVTVNPFDSLPVMRKPHQKVPKIFTDAEIEALLALELRDAVCMCVLLDAGLRKAEARHLRFRDCLPESGQVIVVEGKGGKDRIVPMTARLAHLLNELMLLERVSPDEHVFYSVKANDRMRKVVRSGPVGEGTFARWWRRCLTQAGVRYRVPHTTRHTFATRWRRLGLAIDDLQILLGHASINTTASTYTHTTVFDVAERMRRIELNLEAQEA
jgi:integrase